MEPRAPGSQAAWPDSARRPASLAVPSPRAAPSPAPQSVQSPSPRPTALSPKAPARYLVRHGDGGFTRGSPHHSGLRQAEPHSKVYKSVPSLQHNTAAAGTSSTSCVTSAARRGELAKTGKGSGKTPWGRPWRLKSSRLKTTCLELEKR